MKTIEEKAKAYAIEASKGFILKGQGKEFRESLRHAYLAGAVEALAGQWRKPDKELPKDGQMVLICEYFRSAKNGRFVNHIREFMFFEQYGFKLEEKINAHLGYRITHWMPIPEPPKDESE